MATAFVPNKKAGLGLLSNGVGPLTSAGDIGGGGTSAVPGQQFSDQKGSTDFVNSDKLLAANAGKGQTMLDKAGQGQIDSTADYTDLDAVKGYNPEAGLSTSTGSTSATTQNTGKDAVGNTKNWSTTAVTPTTTTAYNGLSTGDIDAKKANIDSLRTKFNDLSTQYSDSPSGVGMRQAAQQKSVASAIPTYSAQQGGFDSFLMENEGNAPGADGKSSIENRRNSIGSLMTKFDGIDQKTADVKTGINTAQGKVGTVAGNVVKTDSAVLTTPTTTNSDGVEDPAKAQAIKDGFQITGKDGSISYYAKNGELITKVDKPDSSKDLSDPNGGFSTKDAQGVTWKYDKNGNLLGKS